VEFAVLGPVEVRHDGHQLPAGSGRERLVLAALLLDAGRTTTADFLIGQLWEQPPPSAKAQLHNLVSRLRHRFRTADPAVIETRPTGYRLELGTHRLDLAEFRQYAEQGHLATAAGDHAAAVSLFSRALAMWRGPALADVPGDLAGDFRESLHRERLAATEAKLEALSALGDHNLVLRELEPLLLEQPYRESLYQRRMTALAATGRRAEALKVYRSAYRRFVDDLGVEPGAALRQLEQRILQGLPVGALSAPAPRPVPRQLPPDTLLTGRDDLLGEVCGQLRDGAVVLLVGPGGIGKSALATAAGHQLAGQFGDGQLYADLRGSHARPADPYDVLGRFLRALGVAGDAVPTDPARRVAMYRDRLVGSRVLVVLDDADDAEQVLPLLPRTTGSSAVVTSRRQLSELEAARFTMSALTSRAAVRLLSRVVGAERVAAEPDAAARIVALCGALPLAVCVAAARLAVRPHWSLAESAGRLAAERGRLDELAIGDLDVRASIGLSYQALAEPTRRLFRRLGLIGTPDWPAWVAQLLTDDASDCLEQLVDIHLVESLGEDPVGQPRYRLHDLIAEYAVERALVEDTADVRVAAQARVLDGWHALAGEADDQLDAGLVRSPVTTPPLPDGAVKPPRGSPTDWFEVERHNLVAAMGWARQLGHAETAGALALRSVGFLSVRCYEDDRERVLADAAAAARDAGADLLLLDLLRALAGTLVRHVRMDRLQQVLAEEITVAKRLGDPAREAAALTHSGWAAARSGHLGPALAHFETVIALGRKGLAAETLAESLSGLAVTLLEAGRAADALAPAAEAVELQRRKAGQRSLAVRLSTYVVVLTELDRLTEAEATLSEAISYTEAAGDAVGSGHLAFLLAEIRLRQARWPEAEKQLAEALTTHEQYGYRPGTALALRGYGDLAARQGDLYGAVDPLLRSWKIWRDLRTPIDVARTLARLGDVSSALDDAAGAATYRDQWRGILGELELDEACLRLPPQVRARPAARRSRNGLAATGFASGGGPTA
jgi:DNA-binding SARP family transcriptional activator